MRTALIAFAVAVPMVLFFAIMMAFIDGHISVATVLLAAFAICAVSMTAVVFHGKQAMGELEEDG